MTWERVRLGEVAGLGRVTVEPRDIKAGTLYVGLENLTSSGQFENVSGVDAGELGSNKFAFSSGCLLYGKLRPYLRKIAIPDFGGICSTDILPIIPDSKRIDVTYLKHFLRTDEMVSLAVSRCAGANLPRLNPKVLLDFEIPLPPLPVQRRIAAVLDEVDALRQKRERSIEVLGHLLDASFAARVGDPITGQYRFPTKPGREVYKLASGKFFRREEHSGIGEIPAFGGSGLTGWADYANFFGETIIIGRVGFHCGNVQLVKTPTFITDNAIYIRQLSSDFNVDYLYHFLRLAKLNRFRDPGDLKKITQKPLDELLIPAPPLAVQNAFAEEIQETETLMAQAQASQEHISKLVSSLQTRAFSGELDLRELALS